MKREIKFRAWDSVNKKWFHGCEIYGSGFWLGHRADEEGDGVFSVSPKKDCQLVQFTGLKDRNGKEIYEGDIVKMSRFNGIYNYEGFCEIVFRLNKFTLEKRSDSNKSMNSDSMYFEEENEYTETYCELCCSWIGGKRWRGMELVSECRCKSTKLSHKKTKTYSSLLEIIGNIYENPELLKGQS